ncbi:MAG: hypothetical protein MK081_01120 [Flavobacteriales bacterium]|nr:hypothetical protein [Flavobacteriales bacterium]
MRKLIKIALRIFAVFVVAIVALLTWAYVNEDELEQEAVQALEAGLLTDMSVQEIDLSVIRRFPNISLACSDVFLTDTFGEGDTLLWADEVSFELGLFSALSGNYSFKQVRISDGGMHLIRDEKGRDNYHFWRASESTDSTNATLDISKVKLHNIHFRMVDDYSKVYVETLRLAATVDGAIQGDTVRLVGDLQTPHAYVDVEGKNWVPGIDVSGQLETVLAIEAQDYQFTNVDLQVADFDIEGDARFHSNELGVLCDMEADLERVDLSRLRALLPPAEARVLNEYQAQGMARGHLSLAGLAGQNQIPAWSFNGELKNGLLTEQEQNIELDDIRSQFEVSGGGENAGILEIAAFKASLEGGKISLNGQLNDFETPVVLADIDASFDLGDLQRFLQLDSIGAITGELELEARFSGSIPMRSANGGNEIDPAALRSAKLNGKLELDDVGIALHELPRPLERINGEFELEGEIGRIKEARVSIGDTDLELTGEMRNLLPWLVVKGEVLDIQARCESDAFDLASFLTDDATSEEAASEYEVFLTEDLHVTVDVEFDHFTFREFIAHDVKGEASLSSKGIFFDPLHLNTADGELDLQVSLTPNQSGYSIVANAGMKQMDVKELFLEFEQFGQDFITSNNVRGDCTATATFRAYASKSLEIDAQSIESNIDLKVENGELIGLKSMKAISDFMRENKLINPFVRADELEGKMEHIRFATLENQIRIDNGKIYFPTMDIKSSAMDITISGTHWFDQKIDYSLSLYLRDILIQKNQTEFGVVEDDGLGNRFFLSMTGTTDDPSFGYDRLARKEQRKEERRQEREDFKDVLREELGIFKGSADTTKKAEKKPEPNGSTITVHWGDEGEEKSSSLKESTSSGSSDDGKKKKKRWRLLNDDDEEETEDAPEIDDDDDY